MRHDGHDQIKIYFDDHRRGHLVHEKEVYYEENSLFVRVVFEDVIYKPHTASTVRIRHDRDSATYIPQSIDTSRIKLSADLLTQTEQLAKNIHDVCAMERISEGWQYGAERSDEEKTTPCLVTYEDLPENEKEC